MKIQTTILITSLVLIAIFKVANLELFQIFYDNDVQGYIIDHRDQQKYNIALFGEQVWMTDNLNYKTDGSSYYDGNDNYAKTFGRLYTWESLKSESNSSVCPKGFHVPTVEEYEKLIQFLGGKEKAGAKMKAAFQEEITVTAKGEMLNKFSALPAGMWNKDFETFQGLGKRTRFWTSSPAKNFSNGKVAMSLTNNSISVEFNEIYHRTGLSCRCVMD